MPNIRHQIGELKQNITENVKNPLACLNNFKHPPLFNIIKNQGKKFQGEENDKPVKNLTYNLRPSDKKFRNEKVPQKKFLNIKEKVQKLHQNMKIDLASGN